MQMEERVLKKCVNCGIELTDDEYFCGGCGTYQPDTRSLGEKKSEIKVEDEADYESESKNEPNIVKSVYKPEEEMIEIDMEKDEPIDSFNTSSYTSSGYNTYQASNYASINNRKTKNPAKIAIVVVCIIGILLAGYIIKDRFIGSPKKTAVGFMDALCDFNADKMLDYYAGGENKNSEEAKQLKAAFALVDLIAAQYDITYKIKSYDELSGSKEKDFWDNATDETVFVSERNVKKVVICKVSVTTKDTSTGMSETAESELYIGKYKGKWKVIGMATKE